MAQTVKEIQLRRHDCFDNYDDAGCDDCCQSNNVHGADDVEEDVTRTSQVLWSE